MVKTWKAQLQLFSDGEDSSAHVVLTTDAGNTVHGHGRARRNPADAEVPEIGEELAAARALRDLADKLLELASGDISEVEHKDVHLQR
jgi:hypothetical protein